MQRITAWIMLQDRFVKVVDGERIIDSEVYNYVSQSEDATGVSLHSIDPVGPKSAYHYRVILLVRDSDHLAEWKNHIRNGVAREVVN